MKNLIFLTLALFTFCFSYSQQYFETSWISNDVKYTALVIFYDDQNAIVRVKYFANGSDKLADFTCTYKDFTKTNGSTDKYLNGYGAVMIRGPVGSSYSADNFYLKKLGNGDYQAYTVDDNGFKGGDITQYMKPMLYWIPIKSQSLTQRYLDDYFDKDDRLFQVLSFVGNGQADFTIYDAAITVVGHGINHSNPPNDKGLWAVAMSDLNNGRYSMQTIKQADAYPSDWIKKKWGEGYFITSLAYDTFMNRYLVVMSKGSNLKGPQSWKKSDTFPKEWVSEKWDDLYHITSMTCGGGNWYLAMTKNTGYGTQRWKTSYDIPKEWINESWNSGHAITSATYGNGVWALCMSKNANLGLQTWKSQHDYPLDWIREKADDGYKITSIAYGNDLWFVVMSNTSNITYNTSITSFSELPINWIFEKAKEEY